MKKAFSTLLVCTAAVMISYAQKAPQPQYLQPFGKIDKADLEMKSCDFEKDANAMVLFDKGNIYYGTDLVLNIEHHKRVKIFNDNGKNEANIRIEYISSNHAEFITNFQAQTINIGPNGQVEIIKLDKKTLYTENVDKSRSAYVFTFPNVKPGSVIEYKYTLNSHIYYYLPEWSFQSSLPERYNELTTEIPDLFYFKLQSNVRDPFTVNKTGVGNLGSYGTEITTRGMANVHSVPDEPYMRSIADNVQNISYQLVSVKPISGFTSTFSNTWEKVGTELGEDEDFGLQFKRKLANEEAIISRAKSMKKDDDKIAYIFNEVKNSMKWDGVDRWYTNDGTVKAWEKKTGNSAEVNLILFHLLKQAGVKAYAMVNSTRSHGSVNPGFSSLYQFNRASVYIPVDSSNYYLLDATSKYNAYNEIPADLLNTTGFYIDKETKAFNIVFIAKNKPVFQTVYINASIMPDARLDGTLQLTSSSYNRLKAIKRYKNDGEQKYLDFLKNSDNTIKLSALKLENMDVDSLPLIQAVTFKQELTGSDGNFIYFAPSVFAPLRNNPFISENRFSDVDFGYLDNFALTGNYKLPAGYKTETLPKNITMEMPDKSITFRRIFAEQDGNITVRYTVSYKKTIFFKESYDDLRDFYKKLGEMLNEQIVLKKS
jgi:hypothetical protein